VVEAATQSVEVDVLVNGNRALAQSLAQRVRQERSPEHVTLRVWDIPVPDKAYTWNLFVHDLWPHADRTYFVDGYAQVLSNALSEIDRHLSNAPQHVLLASGVPTHGRSSHRLRAQMLREGGVHGNLYAMPATTMRALRERQFRLPVGLYRTDATLGAALAYGLHPADNEWDMTRLLAVSSATWSYEPKPAYSPRVVITEARRRLRQARGLLENRAVRQHLAVARKPVGELPGTAKDLILDWVRHQPWEARRLFIRNPLSWLAARGVEKEVPPPILKPPALLFP
jgi:hypothetical protein